MREMPITALKLLLLVAEIAQVFTKVLVLRGAETYRTRTTHTRRLLCMANEDGNAIVWNYNLDWKEQSYAFSDKPSDMSVKHNYVPDRAEPAGVRAPLNCKFNESGECTQTYWQTENWRIVDSVSEPMGPVFDSRWEGFAEQNNDGTVGNFNYARKFRKTGKLVFSVRGIRDAHLALCNDSDVRTSFCYWVIVGGWMNVKSGVRKCAGGLPETYPDYGSECYKLQEAYEHEALSTTEWRTYVLSWNEENHSVHFYDMEKNLIAYYDKGNVAFNNGEFYYMFTKSLDFMLYRFHIYTYMRTTTLGASLTSVDFEVDDRRICVRAIVGLCATCSLRFALIDATNLSSVHEVTTVVGTGTTPAHGLPTWRNVLLNVTVPQGFGQRAYLRVTPHTLDDVVDPVWAIASIDECPPEEATMIVQMDTRQDRANSRSFWPNVTCQKLSYDGDEVVSVLNPVGFNFTPDDYTCPYGRTGLHCQIQCKARLGVADDCMKVVMCEKDGCTCRAGAQGDDCEKYCGDGKYGYGCKQTCDNCTLLSCNQITGECNRGCNNTMTYHIAPFCQAEIVLPPPKMDYIGYTSARVSLIAKDEYKMLSASYNFTIEPTVSKAEELFTKISPNAMELTKNFENLEPGTVYIVRAILFIQLDKTSLKSPEITFSTLCTHSTAFEVTAYETSVVLKNNPQSSATHPCPATWYSVVLEELPMGLDISDKQVSAFPRTFDVLKPYTTYKVEVRRSNITFFSTKVTTLEGAPTQVRFIKNTFVSATNATLEWVKPERENGVLRYYEVHLEVDNYLGCEGMGTVVKGENRTTTTEITTGTLTKLHPFTKYRVSVTPYTTKAGPVAWVDIQTLANELPTAVISNLTFKDNTLSWNNPADCRDITGPIWGTKIRFFGVSENVRSFADERDVYYNQFKLGTGNQVIYGLETYRAKLYLLRTSMQFNENAYSEITLVTAPMAPPPIRNLEIFEMDNDAGTISLRWQEPKPPTNGQLEYYAITFCNLQCTYKSATTTVPMNQTCSLWSDYICATVERPYLQFPYIMVQAFNKNVRDGGLGTQVEDIRVEPTPTAPMNFKRKMQDGAVIDLSWDHPWRTGGPLKSFFINITLISTKLREATSMVGKVAGHNYPVTTYQPRYGASFYLQPSCNYTISISAITRLSTGAVSVVQVTTPTSLDFASDLKWTISASDSTILLDVPRVINDTVNSAMYVVVVGPRPCEGYVKVDKVLRQQTNVMYYETAWIAAVLSTSEHAGNVFTVGDNGIYGGATNCPLHARELYVVIVAVQSERGSILDQVVAVRTPSVHIGDVPPRTVWPWLVPLLLLLVLAVVAFVFWRRRKRNKVKALAVSDDMSLSQQVSYECESIRASPYEIRKGLESPKPRRENSLSRDTTPDILQTPKVIDEKEFNSSLVKVKDFQDYVRKAIETGLLDRQYETFPRGATKPCEYGKIPQNKSKNRYANLIAYDETRVVLEKLPNDPYSDYINANYIQGYKKDKSYIATQGPKTNTVIDFWRMIWQEKTLVICMLANTLESGKTKCEQYWPDIGKKKKYGNIVVLNAKHNVFADYTFRTWQVTCGQETRKIEHLHYTAWPDHGVPLYTHSVVTYLKKLLATPTGNGPVVVHCSAGVGRTGTIILCDVCLHRAAAEGVVDVLAETKTIRSQRANMVDNKQQYLLAHLALVECLLSLPTALPCNESLPLKIKELKMQLVIQLQRLQDTAWQDEALRPSSLTQPLTQSNIAKNRFPELVTEKISRVYLKRFPPSAEDSDYISAVYVDGVKMQNQYLASQLPMPGTLSDFWRMIAEFKVELIIMLQPPDPEDPTCCAIAPKCGEFKPTSYMNVTTEEATTTEYYSSQKAILVDNSEKPPRSQPITILCATGWAPGRKREPPSTIALVTLWQAAEKISRGDGPTVTLCHDGVSACGLFLALSFLLERMAVERECDVCLAVRAVRRSRADFIQTLEQLEYLYDAAITYLQYFETYANFS